MSLEEPQRRPSPTAAEPEGRRVLGYAVALNEALTLAMERDPNVFVMGQGVTDDTGVFGVTVGLRERFGPDRVFEVPLSEAATMGIAVGAALRGKRPVFVNNRPDFLYLMMDQIVNHASKWSYMFDGRVAVPLVVWAPVARGWGTGAQHTQAVHGLFMHVPGLKIVTPSNAADAKGLLLSAIFDDNPVLFFDHRLAMRHGAEVPAGFYTTPLGAGVVKRPGQDMTVVTFSHGVLECLKAAETLEAEGISCEVLDLRSLAPLDRDIVLQSVSRTGRAIVFDAAWPVAGAAAELSAMIAESCHGRLKAPVRRITCAEAPTPAAFVLEAAYYPGPDTLVKAVRDLVGPVFTPSA